MPFIFMPEKKVKKKWKREKGSAQVNVMRVMNRSRNISTMQES
jgi:hypothetical protein